MHDTLGSAIDVTMDVLDERVGVQTEPSPHGVAVAVLLAVSHDLRAPLAAAKIAVEGLRSPDIEFSHEDRRELLDLADESLTRVGRLAESLLDASRLQVGGRVVSLQSVNLAEVILRGIDELGRTGLDIRVHLPGDLPEVYADAALLERVLVNLLSNALLHGHADQRPTVTAGARGGKVEVRVVDHGPGVHPADWARIFQPFERLGGHDNSSGVGLGLTLSRKLAQAMDGTIVPAATPGGGLTMTLTLPAAEPVGGGSDKAVLVCPLPPRSLEHRVRRRRGMNSRGPRRSRAPIVTCMQMEPLRMMGAHEIRIRLGVSRQRVYQLTSRKDFPEPAADLAQGKIWHAEDVEAWIASHRGDQ